MCLAIGIPTTSFGSTPTMQVVKDPNSGQILIREGERPVLQYNYETNQPPVGFLEKVHTTARKYAVPRSNYIHPLYGPDGEVLTQDWSTDHPHHRGIYWAWPEVDFGQQRGDLHALQRVFARPTGQIQLTTSANAARIEAENLWKWEDETPVVRERATIVAHRAGEQGQFVDLSFQFTALVDGVKLARRGTKAYGGLNIRLSPTQGLKLAHHLDPASATPRRAWSDSVGMRAGGTKPVGLAVFEKTTNPDYPGDYIEYPKLPWFQPTFPQAGTRFELNKGQPLVLEYRLWIRRAAQVTEAEFERHWREFNITIPEEPSR
jgi:hypothetical protein